MSYATKQEAQADARKFKPLLPNGGKGWKTRVHENLGWHLMFYQEPVSVYYSNDGPSPHWSCLISDDPAKAHYGKIWGDYPRLRSSYQTPQGAINAEIRKVRAYMKRMHAVVAAIAAIGMTRVKV